MDKAKKEGTRALKSFGTKYFWSARISWKMVNTGCREKDDRLVDEIYERGRDDKEERR